ncbi:hypothetical protein D3C78_1218250 [compost metagenome]
MIALVAGARHRQFHQRHTGVGPALGFGRGKGHRQGGSIEMIEGGQGAGVTLTLQIDFQRAGRFVDQERIQTDQRVHRRPATDDAGQARCHAGGRLGDLAGKQDQCLLVRVPHREFDHHLAAVLALAVGTVGRFAAEQFDVDFTVGRPSALAEHLRSPGDDCIADTAGLGHGIDAGDQAAGGAAKAIRIRGADLVLRRRGQALGAVHLNTVVAVLLEFDLAEITDHVG